MNLTTSERWAKVRHHLMQYADKLEHDAGMSGAYNDGGAHVLRDKVKAFEAGLQGRIPVEWECLAFAQEFRRPLELPLEGLLVAPMMDPEFAEYERLKAKFERRSG